MNLGVVDTVNGRRMKRRGLTGSPSAARREGREGGGRYRVQGKTDGWHKGEASECVWLLLLLPEGRGGVGWSRGKDRWQWDGQTGDRLRVLTASVKPDRPEGSANRMSLKI